MCCAQLWDNFHQVWHSTTYPCLYYSVLMPIRYVTLWPWPLTSWPWTFITLLVSAFKRCTKFERNRLIHGWAIDYIACFRRAILWGGAQHGSQGPWTQLHQTLRGHRAIIPTQQTCFRVPISCCIFQRGRLKVEWKLEEGLVRSLYQLLKLYRTSGIHLIAFSIARVLNAVYW